MIARYAAGDTLREESLAILPMKGSRRGEVLYKCFVELAKKQDPSYVFNAFYLHQEELCAHMCGKWLGEVMSLVILVVNLIVARALNDRQFKTLLDEVGNYYPGLLHNKVSWLPRGKVLSCSVAFLSKIRTFLEMKDFENPELTNTEWLLRFY